MTESQEVGQYAYLYMSSSQYLDAYYRVIGLGNIALVTLRGWLIGYDGNGWSVPVQIWLGLSPCPDKYIST